MSVAYVTFGGRLFAAWTDIPLRGGGGGSGCGYGAGSVQSADGRSVELTVTTKDGQNFQVTLNGTVYSDLGGTLFLIRTRGPDPEVRQVARDLRGLPATEDTWRQLAKDEPEVKRFIDQVESKK